jgi:hypothetical protein
VATSNEVATNCVALKWTATDTQSHNLPGLAKRGYVTNDVTNFSGELESPGGHKIGHSA